MAGQSEETLAAEMEQVPADPWAEAFAALRQEAPKDTEADTTAGGDDGGDDTDAQEADGSVDATAPAPGDGSGSEGEPGGPGDIGDADLPEDAGFDWDSVDISEEEIKARREQFDNDINQRVINDVARAYIDRGFRNTDGRLGASINDPDICKRDRDGIPHFYNPETGREFTGDNPRRQASEWVEDYNNQLREMFNRTCAEYHERLMQQEGGRIAVLEFVPKYKALDPVRRSMFESIIEDYEVTDDNGDVVAYSCDLDKMLAAVNRQVQKIQQRFAKQTITAPAAPPSGPVLDTPTTTPGQQGNARPQFKSLEEAMEWEQDQLLAKRRNK